MTTDNNGPISLELMRRKASVLETIMANMDNARLTDAQFRELVRSSTVDFVKSPPCKNFADRNK